MGQRGKTRLAAILLAALLFSGCGKSPPEWLSVEPAPGTPGGESVSSSDVNMETMQKRREEFQAFLETVNQKRRDIYNGKELDFPAEWAGDPTDPFGAFPEEEIAALAEKPETDVDTVTGQEAAEDIRTLFRILRQGYAAYDYFGGSEVFSAAEQELLAETAESGAVNCTELSERIVDVLRSIVTDNHLTIKGVPCTAKQHRSYYVPGLFLDEQTAAGIDPSLVKRGIDEEGRLCYMLAASLTEEDAASLPETIVLGGKTTALSWEVMAEEIEEELAVAASELADGTPVLISRTFSAYDEKASVQLDALSRIGGAYGAEPLLIWDLRSNREGNDSHFKGWLAGFAGNSPKVKVAYAGKITPLNRYLLDFIISPGWYVDSDVGEIRERDGLVLALQDDFTASAGEGALDMLRALENAVMIGSCTSGTMVTGNCVRVYLPHSGIPVEWGTKLQQIEINRNPDGIGWEPDLWVPSEDVLSRVEKMIGYYGLRDFPT